MVFEIMKTNDLKRLVDAICGLSAGELGMIKKVVERQERKVEEEIIEAEMFETVNACPHCKSKELKSAGSKNGYYHFRT